MEEQNNSRRISTSNNNTDSDSDSVVDRISGLPDCILSVILSNLPTYEAVATSLLSKRWKFSWLDVLNLHFDSSHHRDVLAPPDDAENMAFILFVHRVLILTGVKPLNKFRLCWADGIMLSHVICWLDAAIMRKVREVDLYYPGFRDLFKLPISSFICDSLRSLKVQNISFVYDDTTDVCFPRLETLKLYRVRFTSEEAFEKLINGCPMLHSLNLIVYEKVPDLDDDDGEEDFMYTVSSPSLKGIWMFIEGRSTLKLKTPSLECLDLFGCISEIFVDESLSSLVEAQLCIFETDGPISYIGAVRALEHVKVLELSTTIATTAFALATACLSTKFKGLVKLVVRTDCLCCVQDLVNKSENLEELEIRQNNGCDAPHDVPHDHSRWTAPIVVPRCLSKSLKKIRLSGYNGLEDEREMIRFMLEHGIALENVEIRCKNQEEDGEKLLKEICAFPRKSLACQVSTWEW